MSRDVLRLLELQARLAGIDFREFATRAIGPVATLFAAATLGLAGVGVGLAGIGEIVAEQTELSPGGALALVAVGALILTVAVSVVAARKLREATLPLARTHEELIANIRSIADAIHPSDGSRLGQKRSQ